MAPAEKSTMKDAIDIVKVCEKHTVDQQKKHHAHLITTLKDHDKLIIDSLEYDLPNPIRPPRPKQNKTKLTTPCADKPTKLRPRSPRAKKPTSPPLRGQTIQKSNPRHQQPPKHAPQPQEQHPHRTRTRVRHKALEVSHGKEAPGNLQTTTIPRIKNSGGMNEDDTEDVY